MCVCVSAWVIRKEYFWEKNPNWTKQNNLPWNEWLRMLPSLLYKYFTSFLYCFPCLQCVRDGASTLSLSRRIPSCRGRKKFHPKWRMVVSGGDRPRWTLRPWCGTSLSRSSPPTLFTHPPSLFSRQAHPFKSDHLQCNMMISVVNVFFLLSCIWHDGVTSAPTTSNMSDKNLGSRDRKPLNHQNNGAGQRK
jgi:hypothetical protein